MSEGRRTASIEKAERRDGIAKKFRMLFELFGGTLEPWMSQTIEQGLTSPDGNRPCAEGSWNYSSRRGGGAEVRKGRGGIVPCCRRPCPPEERESDALRPNSTSLG